MKLKESSPNAPILIESLRSLGYSFETAVADILDNSISANAKNIDIRIDPSGEPSLIILDDGHGMSRDELEEALRFGSRSPSDERAQNDLGRFGLGLKSASLSQCKRLTVASKNKSGEISCFSWDIDKVKETGLWSLIEHSQPEIDDLPHIDTLKIKSSGTYVLLQKFDRLSSSSLDVRQSLNQKIIDTEKHLALVFHRIMSEDSVAIRINNREIIPLDPFLENHNATQKLRQEVLDIDGEKIIVQPYILPHMNKLSREDESKAGGKDDLRANQGFYIYRCKRLIIWGTWFRLCNKNELNKLARVKVDIPNTLDEIWSIDVKKSTAGLPDKIRKNLLASIKDTVFGSKQVIGWRGECRGNKNDMSYIWERCEGRDNSVFYQLNRNLPQIRLLYEKLDISEREMLDILLKSIEENIPVNHIYYDVANDCIDKDSGIIDLDELLTRLRRQLKRANEFNLSQDELLEILLETEPYGKVKDELKELLRKEN